MTQLPWRVALRIAWREMRASRARFLFVVLAVAVGVGLAHRRARLQPLLPPYAAGAGPHADGGRPLGARLRPAHARTGSRAATGWPREGVRRTWITETVTMASSAGAPNPLLISVKAVDPAAYPFYGEVQARPAPAAGAGAGRSLRWWFPTTCCCA